MVHTVFYSKTGTMKVNWIKLGGGGECSSLSEIEVQ